MEYLRILRRRWWVLLLATLLGFSVACDAAERGGPSHQRTRASYTAYSTLISDPLAPRHCVRRAMGQAEPAHHQGDVPQTVERRLGTLRRPPSALDRRRLHWFAAVAQSAAPRSVGFPFAT
jgi:uncharacterized protein involved in exopolysaccharide biosynthesis